MTEPASDELIEHLDWQVKHDESLNLHLQSNANYAALIARIREQDAVMDQMKGTIDDLLAALKGGEA